MYVCMYVCMVCNNYVCMYACTYVCTLYVHCMYTVCTCIYKYEGMYVVHMLTVFYYFHIHIIQSCTIIHTLMVHQLL